MQINTCLVSRQVTTVHSRGPKGNQATELKESNNLCFICSDSFQLLSTGVFGGEYLIPFFFLAQQCTEAENKNLGKNNLKIDILKKNWHLGQCPCGELVRLFLCVLYFSVASQNLLLRDPESYSIKGLIQLAQKGLTWTSLGDGGWFQDTRGRNK